MRSGVRQVEALRRELEIEEPSLLNLVLCDGQRAVATRFVSDDSVPSNSLYVHQGRRYECEDGLCRMVPAEEGARAVIVASEPLSEDDGWHRVPDNHLVVVRETLEVEVTPIAL